MYNNPTPRRRGAPSGMSFRWPLNEIMMQTLVYSGLRSDQIADRFAVSPDQVRELRAAYGL